MDGLRTLGCARVCAGALNHAGAFGYKNRDWLAGMPPAAAAAVGAIAAQFAQGGTEELENARIFEVSGVRAAGGLAALKALGKLAEVLMQTKEHLFLG